MDRICYVIIFLLIDFIFLTRIYLQTTQNIVFGALKPIPLSSATETAKTMNHLNMNFTTGPQLLII